MPRPTAAQLVYGSATVVLSTLAMLLLSRTSMGVGVAVIALAALGLGLLVAVTCPLPGSVHRSRGEAAVQEPVREPFPVQRVRTEPVRVPASPQSLRMPVDAESVREPVRGPAGS